MAVQMRAPVAAPKEITYEKYLRLPATNKRHEIVDGVLIMSPAPTDVRQWDLSCLNDAIKGHVTAYDLGVVLFAPMDLIIRKLPKLTTRQPDLAFFSWESIGGRGLQALKTARRKGVAPDLAVELYSPDQTKRSLQSKLDDFASIGIAEVWLGSRERMSIEVLVLESGVYRSSGIFANGERLVSRILPGLNISTNNVFVD